MRVELDAGGNRPDLPYSIGIPPRSGSVESNGSNLLELRAKS
jgi:hypothetical protein